MSATGALFFVSEKLRSESAVKKSGLIELKPNITKPASDIKSSQRATVKVTATSVPTKISPTNASPTIIVKNSSPATPTHNPTNTPTPTLTPSPTPKPFPISNSFYGIYLDQNLNEISIPGLKVTIESDGYSSSSTNSPRWEFTGLEPKTYNFTFDLPSGYTMQSMVCTNCTDRTAHTYSGSTNQMAINIYPGRYYGVNIKLTKQ